MLVTEQQWPHWLHHITLTYFTIKKRFASPLKTISPHLPALLSSTLLIHHPHQLKCVSSSSQLQRQTPVPRFHSSPLFPQHDKDGRPALPSSTSGKTASSCEVLREPLFSCRVLADGGGSRGSMIRLTSTLEVARRAELQTRGEGDSLALGGYGVYISFIRFIFLPSSHLLPVSHLPYLSPDLLPYVINGSNGFSIVYRVIEWFCWWVESISSALWKDFNMFNICMC